jgi:septal ring factor EnvC (AmiA/AmiB activator)
MKFLRLNRMRLLVALSLSVCLASAFAVPVQAQVLDGIRSSLSSLWERKSSNQQKAREARAKAQAANKRAHTARARLLGVQKTLVQANATYFNYWHQMKRTEARIVRERHRQFLVTRNYNNRRILFGRRLSAMQRSGRLGYLQIFFGSRTLSDLTRRFYLFNAMVTRDAQLQAELKADKAELERINNTLMAQWHERQKLRRIANKERMRVVNAEKEQRRALQQMLNSRNEMLAYANNQVQITKELDNMIAQTNARRAAALAAYRAEAAEEAARSRRYSRSRRSSYEGRSASRSDDNNYSRSTRSRRTRYRSSSSGSRRRNRRMAVRYERQYVPRRVTRTHYVRGSGGSLKPMSISEIVFKAEDVAIPQSSGSLQDETPARNDDGGVGSEGNSGPVDDFPASDPAPAGGTP